MATKSEQLHMSRVAALGCCVCRNEFGLNSDAEIHHVGNGTLGKRASNYEVIPLCFLHHRGGGIGVAEHAGRKSFESNFGTERELLAQTLELLK
jgi:hypothetical protein